MTEATRSVMALLWIDPTRQTEPTGLAQLARLLLPAWQVELDRQLVGIDLGERRISCRAGCGA